MFHRLQTEDIFLVQKTIRNHMGHVQRRMRHSMIDQKFLSANVKEGKEDHSSSKIFYRPKFINSKDDEKDSENVDDMFDSADDNNNDEIRIKKNSKDGFLFVYQSVEQLRLLAR